MVEPEPSKLMTRVRFPSPAPENKPSQVYLALFLFGTWRSLVARLLWEQDVAGSNPVVPTIVFVKPASCRLFLCSSNTTGAYVLKLVGLSALYSV